MTAQTSDILYYNQNEYLICGINGKGLFNPEDYGIEPVPMSSACWRGYFCEYEIRESNLLLTNVGIGLGNEKAINAKAEEPPTLFGKKPEWDKGEYCFFYKDLAALMPFSGGILIGAGFIRELYVHMGFHPAYKFKTVYESIFENGSLISITDKSPEMGKIRESVAKTDLRPKSDDMKEISEWIESTIKLDY